MVSVRHERQRWSVQHCTYLLLRYYYYYAAHGLHVTPVTKFGPAWGGPGRCGTIYVVHADYSYVAQLCCSCPVPRRRDSDRLGAPRRPTEPYYYYELLAY